MKATTMIYIVFLFLVSSCGHAQQPLKGNAFICDKTIFIGSTIDSDWLTDKNIKYSKYIDTYYIACDKKGVLSIDGELLFVDEIAFRAGKDSTVTSIRGFWLDSKNDIESFVYGVNNNLGKPASIRPYRWVSDNISISIGAHKISGESIKYASISINKE